MVSQSDLLKENSNVDVVCSERYTINITYTTYTYVSYTYIMLHNYIYYVI